MLRMQPFETVFPKSIDETIDALEQHGTNAKICAGGTDLIPNMKHGLHEPSVLVHIGHIKALVGISESDTALEIGANTTLHQLATDPMILKNIPGLATAANAVAGPQLRRMGTLGGNLCLDTRCLYYNQTYFWKKHSDFVSKKMVPFVTLLKTESVASQRRPMTLQPCSCALMRRLKSKVNPKKNGSLCQTCIKPTALTISP